MSLLRLPQGILHLFVDVLFRIRAHDETVVIDVDVVDKLIDRGALLVLGEAQQIVIDSLEVRHRLLSVLAGFLRLIILRHRGARQTLILIMEQLIG